MGKEAKHRNKEQSSKAPYFLRTLYCHNRAVPVLQAWCPNPGTGHPSLTESRGMAYNVKYYKPPCIPNLETMSL